MFKPFRLVSWAVAREDCPISAVVNGSDETTFTFGRDRGAFEFTFDAGALRELVRLGTSTLSEMDALYAKEESEEGRTLAAHGDTKANPSAHTEESTTLERSA